VLGHQLWRTLGPTVNGEAQPLKAGLTLDADVMQDRRRIVEWLLEPAIAARRRTEG
jgi:membrane fusion protein